jgi:hypothetical protein
MDHRAEIKEFLSSRRARIGPERAGLPAYGGNRRVKGLSDLIGELSTRSETFRSRWADHNVRFHRSGRKKLHHPVVGDLEIDFEAMEFPSDPGLTMVVYTAPAGSPTADALKLLASWAATRETVAQDKE